MQHDLQTKDGTPPNPFWVSLLDPRHLRRHVSRHGRCATEARYAAGLHDGVARPSLFGHGLGARLQHVESPHLERGGGESNEQSRR